MSCCCARLDACIHAMQEPLGSWGNEYVRNLAGEIGQEFQDRREADKSAQDLLDLVSQIVPYHMSHNAGGRTCSTDRQEALHGVCACHIRPSSCVCSSTYRSSRWSSPRFVELSVSLHLHVQHMMPHCAACSPSSQHMTAMLSMSYGCAQASIRAKCVTDSSILLLICRNGGSRFTAGSGRAGLAGAVRGPGQLQAHLFVPHLHLCLPARA